MQRDLEAEIAALLEAAETDCSVYEMESPRSATLDRPERYAAYLLDHGLQSLLPQTVTGDHASLAAQLTQCNIEFERADPSADWVSFYARQLVADEVEPHTDTDPGW
jgi:hypothetical protein